MDEGYGFHWCPGQAPYFVTPEGRKLRCKMKGRVPVIGGEVMTTPAAGSAKVATNPVFSCGAEKAHESQEPIFQ